MTWEDRRAAYAAKLKDPRWQKKRLMILDRDGWECQTCEDTTKTLHVHHKYYLPDHDPWDYPDSALVTLCEECHEIETDFLPDAQARLIQAMKQCGMMRFQFAILADVFLRLANNDPHPDMGAAIYSLLVDPKEVQKMIDKLHWSRAENKRLNEEYQMQLREERGI